MAIIKKFRIKNFKQEKELLRLEKISLYFGKRKILEDLSMKFDLNWQADPINNIKFGLDYLSAKDTMYDNKRRFNASKEERE